MDKPVGTGCVTAVKIVKTHPDRRSFMHLSSALSSVKLTVAGIIALAGGILVTYKTPAAAAAWVVLPLCLLALNLLFAICFNVRFRRQAGLMTFHLCLLTIVLLAAWGRLTVFRGHVELAQGQSFDPSTVVTNQRGFWHPWKKLQRVRFEQGDIRVQYAPKLRRGITQSTVAMQTSDGQRRASTVGDIYPLKAAGYRFYTTSNKGYALVLTWRGDDGNVQRGAVHLPSFPLNDWKQINTWVTPAGTAVGLEFHPATEVPLDSHWLLDSRNSAGSITVSMNDSDGVVLETGEQIMLPGGTLRYEGPRMWMGYVIFYDPTLAWLLAAALIGVLAMAWHFWTSIWSRPLTTQSIDSKAPVHGIRVSNT